MILNPIPIECAEKDTIPVLRTFQKQKRVENVSACSQNCNEDPACDYYKFKVIQTSRLELKNLKVEFAKKC